MIVTQDDELAELFRCLRAHGWTRQLKNRRAVESRYSDIDPRFLFVNTGFNVRSTEINAVLGIKQLAKLEKFIVRHFVAQRPQVKHQGLPLRWYGMPFELW